MTTEEALIFYSRERAAAHKEQVGATLYELMEKAERSMRDTLADLREMMDAGVVVCHPTINTVFYKFTNPVYYKQK